MSNNTVMLNNSKKNQIQLPMDVTNAAQAQAPDTAIPPEIAAAMNVPSLQVPKAPPPEQAASPDMQLPTGGDTNTPPRSQLDLSISPAPPPPPVMNAMEHSNNVTDLASIPPSAPPPGAVKVHKGILGHIADFLPLAGAIGGGLEAAGDPAHPPVGAQMFQHALEHQEQLNLERQKMQNVDMPLAQAHSNYFNQAAPAKVAVADINAGAKTDVANIANRFKMTPGGLYDTQAGSLVPETTKGVTVTPEMAQQYKLPPLFIGKPMTLADLSARENAASRNLTTVQGAKGPALVNKTAGTAKDLGLGSPAVSARQAGVVDTEVNGNIVPMTDAQRLAQGAPRASTTIAVGKTENKIFEPAIDADTRLKQMYEQATDKTGASDMALLFNHIAMTGGNVKGLRMGSFLTEEHRKARSIPEDLAVLWNHVSAGQVLSPQQRVNFVRLAEQVRQSKWDAAQREAQISGVNTPVTPDPDLPAIRSLSDSNRPVAPASQSQPGAGVNAPPINPRPSPINRGTVRFVQGTDEWNIPQARVAEFIRTHPKAQRR